MKYSADDAGQEIQQSADLPLALRGEIVSHQHRATAPDGTTIAWSRQGGGDPVVLVHGITESAASFDPLTRRLASTHELITLDLRGHGESGHSTTYDLASMASDVDVVIESAGINRPHLVGHSLGGAVVSAVGASGAAQSVVDIDQSLQLGAFKQQVVAVEPMLRDEAQYRAVIDAMFEAMSGELLSASERGRISSLRRVDQDVVLGTWELLLTEPEDQIAATVDAALAGYEKTPTPYLALFGIDPGDGYANWLAERIPTSAVELWSGHGHYPHLVDLDQFVERLELFWG